MVNVLKTWSNKEVNLCEDQKPDSISRSFEGFETTKTCVIVYSLVTFGGSLFICLRAWAVVLASTGVHCEYPMRLMRWIHAHQSESNQYMYTWSIETKCLEHICSEHRNKAKTSIVRIWNVCMKYCAYTWGFEHVWPDTTLIIEFNIKKTNFDNNIQKYILIYLIYSTY